MHDQVCVPAPLVKAPLVRSRHSAPEDDVSKRRKGAKERKRTWADGEVLVAGVVRPLLLREVVVALPDLEGDAVAD